MATCKDCLYWEACNEYRGAFWGHKAQYSSPIINASADSCIFYKDRSRFVELTIAKKIKHSPDIEKMREFHKLGIGKGMGERSIFWTCSNCESWVSLAHKYCPNCGAKFEAEQALKEREENE